MMLAILTAADLLHPAPSLGIDLAAGAAPDPWMQQASGACESSDFDGLFEAVVRSPRMRGHHSAPQIELKALAAPNGPGTTRPRSVEVCEIALVDYSYADAASVRRRETDPDRPFTLLSVQQRRLADGAVRVDYRPGVFRDEGEGDGMTLVRLTGAPAAYVFSPFGGCWRLTQHLG